MAGNIPYSSQKTISDGLARLKRFLNWWLSELIALVPTDLLPLPRPTEDFVWVEFETGQAVLRQVRAGHLDELGRVDLAGQDAVARKLAFTALLGGLRNPQVGICLPADRILRKRISLPQAASENLRQVLSFELNRHTPFSSDQVYFDYRVAEHDDQTGSIQVDLTVAERRSVDNGLAQLREWNLQAVAVVPVDELVGVDRYVNLLPMHIRPGVPASSRWKYSAMALLTVFLLGVALALPLWQKREEAIALGAISAKGKQRAEAVENFRDQVDKARSEYQFLIAKKVEYPAKVVLLEEITRLLSDDTWLFRLDIRGDKVVINGETNSSTDLIRAMEKSSLLENAAFNSPVVKERNNKERFQLGVQIKKTDPAAALKAQEETGVKGKTPQGQHTTTAEKPAAVDKPKLADKRAPTASGGHP